jgi:flavin-dependent dehydrogenase
MTPSVEVAVVGGGPAGAVVATLLARHGRHVVLLERSPAWRWRACGVFTSPAAVAALAALGVGDELLARLARPIPAMRVEAPGGPAVRLTYGDDGKLRAPARGFDRGALDEALLHLARAAGAEVRTGVDVTALDLENAASPTITQRDGSRLTTLRADVVVGADGIRSLVARAAGVARPARLGSRVGLTFHVRDPRSEDTPRDARMIVLDGAYCGLAPVPGGRLNVGIVLAGHRWQEALAQAGAQDVARRVLAAVPPAADDPVAWSDAERCDRIEGAAPLGHRVVRRAGASWLLVGDAAGFLDPFTGEGLHRALVSAQLAADAIEARLAGRTGSFDRYQRAMSARFRTKDVVSILVQAFLARQPLLGHVLRRLAARSAVRETMGLVMGDLVPAGRALDPRFLAALLRP